MQECCVFSHMNRQQALGYSLAWYHVYFCHSPNHCQGFSYLFICPPHGSLSHFISGSLQCPLLGEPFPHSLHLKSSSLGYRHSAFCLKNPQQHFEMVFCITSWGPVPSPGASLLLSALSSDLEQYRACNWCSTSG